MGNSKVIGKGRDRESSGGRSDATAPPPRKLPKKLFGARPSGYRRRFVPACRSGIGGASADVCEERVGRGLDRDIAQ